MLFIDTDGVPAMETKTGDLVQNDVEIKLIQQVGPLLTWVIMNSPSRRSATRFTSVVSARATSASYRYIVNN